MQETLRVLAPIVGAHVVVLAAILFVIKRLLLSDTMRAVNRIKQVEAEIRKREEEIRKEIEEHEREFARRKADGEEEIQRHKEKSEKETAKLKDQILAEAKEEGDRIVDQARKNEEKLRKQISQDVEEKAVEYGGQVFRLVFSEKMTEELDKQFTAELLEALEEIDSSTITLDAHEAEFTSSHPLDEEQRKRLEKLLADKFGVDMGVKEKIQEDLMAGIILKVGSLEIDGSLANRYNEAVAEVKKTARP